jgi:hypothetical protein
MADDTPLPWPRAGDVLFTAQKGENWTFNACMQQQPSIGRYADGYRCAAELLFKYLEATDERHHNDIVVYPLIFCWRHFLELKLKELLHDTRRLHEQDDGEPQTSHGLVKRWKAVRDNLLRLNGKARADLRNVDEVVRQFVQYDPESYSFRYPTERDSKTSTQDGVPTLINLRNLHEVMERVATFLECAGMEVDAQQDMKDEYESEMRSYYGEPDYGEPDYGEPDYGEPDYGEPDYGEPD